MPEVQLFGLPAQADDRGVGVLDPSGLPIYGVLEVREPGFELRAGVIPLALGGFVREDIEHLVVARNAPGIRASVAPLRLTDGIARRGAEVAGGPGVGAEVEIPVRRRKPLDRDHVVRPDRAGPRLRRHGCEGAPGRRHRGGRTSRRAGVRETASGHSGSKRGVK